MNNDEKKLVYTALPTMDEYLTELRSLLKTPGYIRFARITLGHFSNFCAREGVTHPVDVTRSTLVKFYGVVNTNPNWSESYRKQLMKTLRTYINWLVNVGYIETTPWVGIKVGKVEKKPNPLSEAEVTVLFAAHRKGAFSLDQFYFHRREFLLAVMFAWGLRLHEVAALNNSAFDTRHDYISAINKGGGTKSLPYGDELKKLYNRYAIQRGQHSRVDEDALFITRSGDRLSKDAIYKTVVELGRDAGLDLHPHMMRDTAATTMLDDGMPPERVAKILGHSNIKQTLAYTEIRDQKTAEMHSESMNPRLRMLFRKTGELDDTA